MDRIEPSSPRVKVASSAEQPHSRHTPCDTMYVGQAGVPTGCKHIPQWDKNAIFRPLTRSLDDCAIRRRRRRRRNTSCKWPSHKIEYMCRRGGRRKFLAPGTINNGLLSAFSVNYTELRKSPCTWFGEVCSCCCLPALPGLAWVLLKYVLQRLFLISVCN